jgi:hypothetical protein
VHFSTIVGEIVGKKLIAAKVVRKMLVRFDVCAGGGVPAMVRPQRRDLRHPAVSGSSVADRGGGRGAGGCCSAAQPAVVRGFVLPGRSIRVRGRSADLAGGTAWTRTNGVKRVL